MSIKKIINLFRQFRLSYLPLKKTAKWILRRLTTLQFFSVMHNFFFFGLTVQDHCLLPVFRFQNEMKFKKFFKFWIFFFYCNQCNCGGRLARLDKKVARFWLKIFALVGHKVLGKNTLQNVIFVTLRMFFMTKMT